MASVPGGRMAERGKSCGFKGRSKDHNEGPHHTGKSVKMGGKVVKLGPRNTDRPKTLPKSQGAGFDFRAIKTGGGRY